MSGSNNGEQSLSSKNQILTFTSVVTKYDFGKYYYTVLFLDPTLIPVLPLKEYPKLRINAEVEGIPLNGALMPDKGRWYLMVPRKFLKNIKKNVGDEITASFEIADQNEVAIRPELRTWLSQRSDLLQIWNSLTPGKQRGFAHRINQAKSEATLEKRLFELEEYLLNL